MRQTLSIFNRLFDTYCIVLPVCLYSMSKLITILYQQKGAFFNTHPCRYFARNLVACCVLVRWIYLCFIKIVFRVLNCYAACCTRNCNKWKVFPFRFNFRWYAFVSNLIISSRLQKEIVIYKMELLALQTGLLGYNLPLYHVIIAK